MTVEPGTELHERILDTIRFLAVDAVEEAASGHPGTPMALAGPALEIWDRHLRFDPADPEWPLRDRFVLSAGHASMLLYALLHLYGYDLPLEELKRFRQLGSRTPGHPEYGHTPGVEVTTGPLGQGIAHAVGMALAARMTRSHYGAEGLGPGRHRIYGIASDGDVMEGVCNEAASLAGHLGLGNLVFLYDDNHITIDGRTKLALSEDVGARFEAQGWHVEHADGLDVPGLRKALERAVAEEERPSLIVTRTTIGYGSPNKADTSSAHGSPLGAEEVALTKQALGWPESPTFLVPDDVAEYFAERRAAKRAERTAADRELEAWRKAHPDRAEAWEEARARKVPSGLAAALADGLDGKEAATRKHSGQVIQRLAEALPYVVGGSADLASSNSTTIQNADSVGPAAEGPDPFAGRNLHYGVREHAMAAITNGIALDGTFLPFAATFLIFSDYARPSIRLAALMGIRSTFVFTHDSIFLGEDGPTHQPVEHLDALRAIPRLVVMRPADGVETALCWAWVAEHARGPAALALTRQGVPALTRGPGFRPEDVWKGGYVLREADGDPDVVLVATGSEVGVACGAADLLATGGKAVRVVSMPSLELFAEQPEDYRRSVVPADGTAVVAVEAGRGQSFQAWVGPAGWIHGIDRFGESAPAGDLARHFGFTPEALAEEVRRRLG